MRGHLIFKKTFPVSVSTEGQAENDMGDMIDRVAFHQNNDTRKNLNMEFDDDFLEKTSEIGSDELLSDDNLRLPESASNLVRLHAIRSWLARRRDETSVEIGEAALALQQMMQEEPQQLRPRRRERQDQTLRAQREQQGLLNAQQRLNAYEEAETLLEDCITHTTSGERVLVEYYLTLEELVEHAAHDAERSPWLQAIEDVQHRVEHVGAPNEE